MGRKLTIGALARQTGVSVKTLRYYSDEGLLGPLDRASSGYRLYGEEDAVRVELIRTLRDAGVGIAEIAQVLKSDLGLEHVLRLRLRAVESQIVGLERVRAALEVALRSGPTEENLRRITMATRTSNEERRNIVAAFYRRTVEGLPAPQSWVDDMIDASSPALPDAPSAEQVAAWVELETLLNDASFLGCRRAAATDALSPPTEAVFDVQYAAMVAASEARTAGHAPDSEKARAIVDELSRAIAGVCDDADGVLDRLRVKFDPRGARFWELVAVMRGDPSMRYDDWRWLGAALAHARPDPRRAA